MLSPSEKRLYRRVGLQLPVQVTVNAIDNYDGRLINISPGGLAVESDAVIEIGDAVTATITDLDVIEGVVARTLPDGFSMSYRLSRSRRVALTEQILLRTNPSIAKDLSDRRRTVRHQATQSKTTCRLADGTALILKILNRSVDGMSVEASRRPPVGSEIIIGTRHGVIARHTPRGFVVIFNKETQAPERILKAI